MKKLLLTFSMAALPLFAFAQAVNDECSGAVAIPVNSSVLCTESLVSTFTDSSPSSEAASCGSGNDIWFTFTAIHPGHRIEVEASSSIDFALYTGTCDALTEVVCGDNEDLTGLTEGATYFLRLFEPSPEENDFSLCIMSPLTKIDVDNTSYTAEQLVTDILIDSPCVTVSNISTNDIEGFTGLAYFDKAASNFPFEEGIILMCGNAANVTADPWISTSSNGSGPDEDLEEVLAANNQNQNTTDSTVLEFDFVPQTGYISFNFLFASNEYGTFQCNYTDAFAFLLTDTATGETVNLAVIPGTTIPVSVITIRDNEFNPGCESVNEDYFGEYYAAIPEVAPISMNGATVPMTAEGTVIPGNTYHLKLVIADYYDQAFDAAVFIDAGSFNMGSPDAGEITLEASNGNVLCNGEETTISIDIDGDFIYTWEKDGVVIEDEDTNAITTDEAGVYTVTIDVPGTESCTVEYSMTVVTGNLAINEIEISDIVVFNNSGVYDFNLNTKTQEIYEETGNDDYNITYYLTQMDAENATNPLSSPFTNTENPQVIYVRLEGSGTCYTISSFTIVVLDENYTTPAPIAPPSFIFEEGDTLADIPVEGENIEWYDNPGEPTGPPNGMDGDEPLPMNTLLVDGTTYYAAQTVWGIESLERTPVTVHSTLGTEDTVFKGLMTYPNPVSDILTIKNNNAVDSITVYNSLGQKVAETSLAATEVQISLSGLADGIYMVKIASEGKEKVIKVVKQ